jgi:hypothetical protein
MECELYANIIHFCTLSSVPDPSVWPTVTDGKMCEKIFLRPSLDEIYDLQWSPDSQFVLAGAINSKV